MFLDERRMTKDERTALALFSKSGVSLVTVLLFMLVATIAATATYKWLTSEGRSSASRMRQNEAYQSALAGIESARSWMTYNANETGAIIKQYKDGKNAPIKLTDRLAAFVRAGQHYDVYLVGVNTENTTYKLKILSEGTSRNGAAKHSEVAILNVNGLYRINKPVREVHVHTDFEYAYFGGSILYEGSNNASAMVVNGNWEKNPPKTTSGDFIVTGDASLSGNDITVTGTTCIGGKMKGYQGSPVNGFTTTDFYIAGKAETFVGIINRDAYFDGDMEMGQSCGNTNFQVLGNMTVNAKLNLNHCETRLVRGNTCVLEKGQIRTDGNSVKLEGGAWMEADFPIWKVADDNYNQSENFVVGTDANTKVYIKSGHPWKDYKDLRDDRVYTEGDDHPRNCIEGLGSVGANAHKCWGTPGNTTYAKFWKPAQDGAIHAYPTDREQKEDLYYIYYMQPGYTDVGFGSYDDTYWRWCPNGNCASPESKTVLNGYFINFREKNIKYVFTNSNHKKDCDGPSCENYHKTRVGENWYRYLNYNDHGTEITGSPYCGLASGKEFRPECGVKPWFTMKGSFQPWVSTKPEDLPCAEGVKDHCYSIWEEAPGCDGAKFVVKDQLRIASNKFSDYANKATCASNIATRAENDLDGSTEFDDLWECYKSASAHDATVNDPNDKELYNEYLVVKLSDAKLFKKTDPSAKLSGKYIFILDTDRSNDAVKLPATASTKDYVMLYLPKGFFGTDNSQIYLESSGLFNYFIFSDHDIYGVQGKNHTLSGTIYMKQATCAKLRHMWTSNLEYNKDLLDNMVLNGVVCPTSVSESDCGGTGNPASSSAAIDIEYVGGGVDDYYISVAPQLSVTLESQYKNNEAVSSANAAEIEGSFIVLPRIIYLTTDAKGKLADYYNVIPLNAVSTPGSSSLISSPNVVCDADIPSAGKLTAGGPLPEGQYSCEVTATVNGTTGEVQRKVPFWVVVSGEGGGLPSVWFVNSSEEVGVGHETDVELTWDKTTGAGASCAVTIVATDYEPEWEVSTSPGVTKDGDKFTLTFNTSEEPPKKIMHVRNASSSDGSVLFLIQETEGCAPGENPVEVLFNTNSIAVVRAGLDEYCNNENAGAGTPACEPGGDYYKMIQPDWPDCNAGDEIWVTANGSNCTTLQDNNKWNCGIVGSVSLASAGDPVGCQVVIPTVNNTKTGPFEPNEEITLYAALKAVPQKFHVRYAVTGDLSNDQAIYIYVDGVLRSTCTYGDSKSATRREEKCDVTLYRGSTVKLSFSSNPEEVGDPPNEFNYWLCDEGVDCESSEPITIPYYEMSITGTNTVEAHFGENDKHCFFDEFKDDNHYNRESVECTATNPVYCIEDCDGSACGTISNGGTKWRLMQGSMSDIDYSDGRISLKSSATRGKKESEKANIKTVVMSTAQAGKDGELKAQFQVPIEGISTGGAAKATVKNSGFILRSDDLMSNYLMLNMFATSNGTLTARLCLNGSEDKCKVQTFDRLRSIISTDIIMMSAWLTTVDGASQLNVKVWPGSWAGNLDADQVSFALTDSEIPGVTATAQNEYVGYSLADQNFKLYGIGWRSYTYNAQCWDAPPSISCSFKAAYTGGIVPLNTAVTPWIGFSAWYNDAHVDGCSPVYYYNGNDDGGCVISVDDTDYKKCGSNYQFTEAGAHGYTNNETNQEVKTAKAGVENCYVVGPAAAWASQGVADHCGAFWVGDMNECSRNVTFVFTLNGAEGSYYSVDGTANVREADLKVTLNNPAGDEVEIYLYSINTEERYSYGASQPIYSIPYTTTSNGAITIPVKNLSNVDGFDPERVGGVYVKTSGSASVTSVESACANVVAINSCSAAYDKTAGKWKISTVVNSYTHAKKIKVTESSSHITNGEAECDETTACAWSGVSGRTATNMLPIDDANPYAGSGVRSYTFTVTMTTDDNETLTCETEPVDVSGTEGVCGSLTGANPIKQGAGLPVFSYGISNCPNNNCGYKVLLSDGTEIVASTTSGDGTWNTDANAANKTTSLEPGDYYFTLQSTDNPASFTSCNSETFKVTDSKVTASCSFDNSTIYLGQQASFSASSFSVQNENIAIDFLDPNNQSLETNSSFYANNTYTKSVTPTTTGALTYTLLANGGVACTATLTVNPPSASCSLSSENVEEGDDLTLTVSSIAPASANVDIAVTENTNHKTGANSHWSNNSYTPQWTMSSTGTFTYAVTINGYKVCEDLTVTVSGATSTAETCKFNNTSRVYGEKVKFQVEKLKVSAGTTWEIDDANGTKVADGTYSGAYAQAFWESGEFYAKSGGTYTLKLGGTAACTANLTVTQPTAENCKLDAETISSGGSTTFHWDLKNCKDNQCSYEIKQGGSYFYGEDDVSEQNDRQRAVSSAGEYVVWLNGVETSCKKTLSVAAGGSLTCTFIGANLVGEQGQGIQVVSTRENGTYDVYLDGSIVYDSWNNLQSNISINKNETKTVGNFTIPSGSSHTWKVTAYGSSTALCDGSFTTVTTPKVDCYFIYNSGGATVTGSVPSYTQLQFCTSRAPISKQTTLTGKKKDGDINETNFWISKDNDKACYYFEAPGTGSYTFKVRYNGEDVCNSNPVLVVQ